MTPPKIQSGDLFEPAPAWRWTGVVSTLLLGLEQIGEALAVVPDLPKWALVIVAAIPAVVRFARMTLFGRSISFRRL